MKQPMKLETERFWDYITAKAKKYMMVMQHHAEGVESTVAEDDFLTEEFVEYSRKVDPFESPTPTK